MVEVDHSAGELRGVGWQVVLPEKRETGHIASAGVEKRRLRMRVDFIVVVVGRGE